MTSDRHPHQARNRPTMFTKHLIGAALATSALVEGPEETHYMCKRGCGPILVILFHPTHSAQMGYRLGDYLLQNETDLTLFIPNTGGKQLLIPASGVGKTLESSSTRH